MLDLSGDPIADIVAALDGRGIPYVFTGSVALAALTQEPVGTKDIDVVVYAPSRIALARLLNDLAEAGVDLDPAEELKHLDRDKVASLLMPLPEGAFVVELLRPKVPALDPEVPRRALTVPYPGTAGIRVVTLEDWAVFKLIFFRERDRLAVEDVLRQTPDLDTAYIKRSLGLVYPRSDERLAWLADSLRRRRHKK